MEKPAQSFDICIVCALYEEAEAVLNEFSVRCSASFTREFSGIERYVYQHITIWNKRGEPLTVLVTWLSDSGPTQTGLDLKPFLHEFHPRFVAMTGICAGDRRKVKLGDLVVAQYAYYYEEGKIIRESEGPSHHLPEMKTADPSSQIIQYARGFDGWKEPVREMKRHQLNRQVKINEEPHCIVAPMASGMAVREDDPFPWLKEKFNRNTVALDREAASFYRALRAFPHMHVLVVKGVCDYADMNKNDVYHDFAARASAVYLLSFIQEYVTEASMPRQDAPSFSSRAGLSAIWNIPYPRNPFFIGREELLSQLHQQLKAGQATALSQSPQAISGLGGIGKTQIALEYVYRYRSDYQVVLWAQADTREALTLSCLSIATLLNLPEKDVPESDRVIAAVKDWLRTHNGWLFVLDNADELAQARAFLPPSFEGHVLLTTRAQAMGRFAHCLEVNILPVEQGTLFLLRRAGLLTFDANIERASDDDRDQARRIYEEPGGLPLALDQAGAYIEETGCGLVEYQRLFQSRHADLLAERRGLIDDHPLPVASTWSLSFEQVEQKNPAAADLLRLCAFLAPDAIPEAIIIKGASHLGSQLAPVCADAYLFNQAIGALRAYSLLHRESSRSPVPLLSVHRLVQAMLKDGMDDATKRQWAGRAVDALGASLPEEGHSSWEYYERCLPHVQSCMQLIAQWHFTSRAATRLLYRTGVYLVARGRYLEAEPLYQQALQIREYTFGLDHFLVAYPLFGLAYLYFRQGRFTQAEPLYLRALYIWEQTLGSEHLQVAYTLDRLATLYLDQARYTQAEPLYLRALQIREQILGLEHPDVASSLNGLANLYRRQGQYAQAKPLYLRALRIREQILGLEHPDITYTLNGLANLYREQGQYVQAEVLYLRALSIWKQAVGLEHSQAGYLHGNLALLYFRQGRYTEAEALYLRALSIWEQAVGPEHPSMAYYLISLANLYREQSQDAQAEVLYLRALHIREQALGTENLLTHELADIYAAFLRTMRHDKKAMKPEKEF